MSELGEIQISLERIRQDLLEQPTTLPFHGAIKTGRHEDWQPVIALEMHGSYLYYVTWKGRRVSATDVFGVERTA